VNNPLYVSKTRHPTYNGARADVYTIARSKHAADRCGERVVIYLWVDSTDEYEAGTTVARHITGDGRKIGFIEHDERITDDPMAYAMERLS
jgi:hypothetical protein